MEILQEGTGKTPARSCCQKKKSKGTVPASEVASLQDKHDHPRMAMLNKRIVQAALVIEERHITRAGEKKHQETSISQPN